MDADFLFLPINFFCLKVDGEFPSRGDVGMTAAVSGLGSSAANGTNFTHKITC